MKKNISFGTYLLLLMIAIMCVDASLMAAEGDATTILKTTTSEQISGEIGWLFILAGVVIAALMMMFKQNLLVSGIILVGSIVLALSPDLADGVIQQFGN